MRRALVLVLALGFLACASPGPTREETQVTTIRAQVAAVDHETRMVTLVDAAGNRTTFRADQAVVNLPQVKVGDMVVGELIESLAIEVRKPTDAEKAAPNTITEVAAGAEPGERPEGVYVRQQKALFTIASIDKTRGGGELRDSTGQLHFVKVRDPAVLDQVKVGETVVVTVTESVHLEVVSP